MIVALAASSCASLHRVEPSLVDVQVEAPVLECGARVRDIPVGIRAHNGSRGVLQFWIDGDSGPPYPLSWLSYEVLDVDGNFESRHGPGEHGPMAQRTLKIGPGDRTVLAATLYEIAEADQSRGFRLRLEDQDKHSWTTDAFRPCVKRR